jgi:hypothetical protein
MRLSRLAIGLLAGWLAGCGIRGAPRPPTARAALDLAVPAGASLPAPASELR